jgi:hypothetical protein
MVPPRFLRLLSMNQHRKCTHCDKRAMAYRLEEDGSRIYLCVDHVPGGEVISKRPQLRLVVPARPKSDDS